MWAKRTKWHSGHQSIKAIWDPSTIKFYFLPSKGKDLSTPGIEGKKQEENRRVDELVLLASRLKDG